MTTTPALPELLLVDRDGVLLEHVEPYILSAADVVFCPGFTELFRATALLGCPVAVVTNQSPLGRGLVGWDFVHRTNSRIAALAASENHHDVTFHVCPHLPQDGCACRKPAPGLLLSAARTAGVPPARTWMVGDHDTDMAAARRAGCGTTVHLTSGRQRQPSPFADLEAGGLHEVARLLRTSGRRLPPGSGVERRPSEGNRP
ncbi:D-glycero-alpha-D-manno-heptose-1,7-bisphosphate 7-phosphatase [Streptomyces sp. NPDC050433]|uniref:D-glycero-alpha-D-manno-heptose-1,7-bisphosphate 7-phosphatase n=1 Tax=unclassified Streptomyces TaxID=2593676 RepID=UPI00341639D1